MDQRIIICEHAPGRADAFHQWLPDALVVRRYKEETIPDSFDVLVLGGGPMSVDVPARKQYPFLQEEFDLIQALSPDDPSAPRVIGICLGAQLMALALGGNVEEGVAVRGWNRIRPCVEHPMFPRKTEYTQFEFHCNHIVRLPDRAHLLADSERDRVEAFSIGTRMLATVYHPEVAPSDAERIYCSAGLEPHELHDERFSDPGPSAAFASRSFFNIIHT